MVIKAKGGLKEQALILRIKAVRVIIKKQGDGREKG